MLPLADAMLPAVVAPGSGGDQLPALTDLDVVQDFLDDKAANTLRAYDGDLRDFAKFLGVKSSHVAVGILLSQTQGNANRLALRYKIDLIGRGLKSNTVRRRLAALRSVISLARRNGKIPWSLDCPGPEAETCKDTRGPGDDGWNMMRKLAAEEAKSGSRCAIRDRAMLRLCHDLALRIAELVSLDFEHLEIEELPVAVWILGKGRKERERLSIPPNTGEPLRDWLMQRGDFPGPLFVRLDRAAKEPTRLTSRSAWRYIRDLGQRAGIKREMAPHKLRHHAITACLDRNGGDMVKAQKFSRHKDPKMLIPYIDNLRDPAGEMAELVSEKD